MRIFIIVQLVQGGRESRREREGKGGRKKENKFKNYLNVLQ